MTPQIYFLFVSLGSVFHIAGFLQVSPNMWFEGELCESIGKAPLRYVTSEGSSNVRIGCPFLWEIQLFWEMNPPTLCSVQLCECIQSKEKELWVSLSSVHTLMGIMITNIYRVIGTYQVLSILHIVIHLILTITLRYCYYYYTLFID